MATWIIVGILILLFIIAVGAGNESYENDLKKSGKCWCPQTEGYDGPYFYCDPCLDECTVCNPQNSPKSRYEVFDAKRKCIKCGTSNAEFYHSSTGLIRRDCRTCSYSWHEWPLDKE